MSDVAGVQLADFLSALRDQIRIAQESADPNLPIDVGPISVEFELVTRREGEGKAGVKFWVVDASAGGKIGRESKQKITMQLIPLTPDRRGPARIRDNEPAPARSGIAIRDFEQD